VKHNSYFDGKVQSLALSEPEGPATVGVLEKGSYTFSTSTEELMTIVAGKVRVRLPGGSWKDYAGGETFVVPKGTSFDIEGLGDAAYVCRYR